MKLATGINDALTLAPCQILTILNDNKEPSLSSPERFIAILGGMAG